MTGTGKGTRVYILQLVEQLGLALIVVATLVAVGEEVAKMVSARTVTLADILILFIYLEVIAMVAIMQLGGRVLLLNTMASGPQLAELADRDYYTAANVFWVPEGARWEALRAAAKQRSPIPHRPERDLGPAQRGTAALDVAPLHLAGAHRRALFERGEVDPQLLQRVHHGRSVAEAGDHLRHHHAAGHHRARGQRPAQRLVGRIGGDAVVADEVDQDVAVDGDHLRRALPSRGVAGRSQSGSGSPWAAPPGTRAAGCRPRCRRAWTGCPSPGPPGRA